MPPSFRRFLIVNDCGASEYRCSKHVDVEAGIRGFGKDAWIILENQKVI